MSKHLRCNLIILILVSLTFGNSLSNQFIGDDEIVIVKNDFYKSASNIHRLFDKSYITDSDSLSDSRERDYGSGSIAYRPVLSATYFLDYAVWNLNPFGYHLTNFILHLLTALLVYWLFFILISDIPIAIFGALIFALHPLRSEAVCSIGYRADLLATFFIVLSLILYALYRRQSKRIYYFLSVLGFALALFSKESVISFILVFVLYDLFIEKKPRNFIKSYVAYCVIGIIYLYLYLFTFRNLTLGSTQMMGNDFFKHAGNAIVIFGNYVLSFVNPLGVRNPPPQFQPVFNELWPFQFAVGAIILIAILILLKRSVQRKENTAFFIGWFLITFIPVSNLMPLINPVANRFMYLPSIGLSAWLALLIMKKLKEAPSFKDYPNLVRIIKVGFLFACISTTIALNAYWKDNVTMAFSMIRDYPKNPAGYFHASKILLEKGDYHPARAFLLQSLSLGGNDPRIFYYLGLTSLNNREESSYYFTEGKRRFPKFGLLTIGYGRSLLLQGKVQDAERSLLEGVDQLPSYSSYGYLIQAFLMQDKREQAQEALEKALKEVSDDKQQVSLKKFMTEDVRNLPIDIGI